MFSGSILPVPTDKKLPVNLGLAMGTRGVEWDFLHYAQNAL